MDPQTLTTKMLQLNQAIPQVFGLKQGEQLPKVINNVYSNYTFYREYPVELQEKIGLVSCVEVKPSPIHGQGLFATKDIHKGQIPTFYPVDGYRHSSGTWEAFQPSKNMECSATFTLLDVNLDDYALNLNQDYKITGFPEGKVNHPDFYLGHMINDGIGQTFDFTKTLSTERSAIRNGIARYLLQFGEKINCAFNYDPSLGLIIIIALKEIHVGDELLTSYLIPYWVEKELRLAEKNGVSEDIRKRFKSTYLQERTKFLSNPNFPSYIMPDVFF